MQQCCLVLGMHRSGTSALAGAIAALGATPSKRQHPAHSDNPEGYMEPAALVALHDRLLAATDSVWFDINPPRLAAIPPDHLTETLSQMVAVLQADYGPASFALIKDPRICRFLPLTLRVLAAAGMEPGVVLSLRAPAEVAASLRRRDQLSAIYAGVLWARHMVDAERESRGLPRILVQYERLLSDWPGTAARIRSLPGPWPTGALPEPGLRPDLRHHANLDPVSAFGPDFGPALQELHAALAALETADDAATRSRIDAAAESIDRLTLPQAPLFEAEFRHHRLISAHPDWHSPDPDRDHAALAACFDRLHQSAANS